jgi:hypothetical protein
MFFSMAISTEKRAFAQISKLIKNN